MKNIKDGGLGNEVAIMTWFMPIKENHRVYSKKLLRVFGEVMAKIAIIIL
jgi:hypothetical protein